MDAHSRSIIRLAKRSEQSDEPVEEQRGASERQNQTEKGANCVVAEAHGRERQGVVQWRRHPQQQPQHKHRAQGMALQVGEHAPQPAISGGLQGGAAYSSHHEKAEANRCHGAHQHHDKAHGFSVDKNAGDNEHQARHVQKLAGREYGDVERSTPDTSVPNQRTDRLDIQARGKVKVVADGKQRKQQRAKRDQPLPCRGVELSGFRL